MADYDETFEKGDAGSSTTFPCSVGDIKKGGHMCINGRPCKVIVLFYVQVVDYSTAKTGKHGHAKASIVAIDIFTGKKMEDSLPASHSVDVPNIKRTELSLIAIDADGYCSLMDNAGKIRDDVRLPEDTEEDQELSKRIREYVESGKEILITILAAMDIEKIIEAKEVQVNSLYK